MCDKRRLNTVSESEENPGPSHSRSGGNSRPQFSFPRIFSEPVFRVSRRADFHIENFKWRTRKIGKYQRGALIPGSDRFAGAAFRATNQACEDPDTVDVGRDLELVFGQDEGAVVYKPTTFPVDLSNPLGTDDTMSRYREEMSESDPLRGNDEWSGVGEQARSNIWKRHATTLAWAIFLGALAVSVLVLAAVLAIVLEYNNSSVAMNSTVNGTGVVTRAPMQLNTTVKNTTGGKLKSESSSPAMLMLTKSKSSKYERISGKNTVDSSSTIADPDDDFTRLTARSKWPLTDTTEKATIDFKRELKLGAAGPTKVIDVTSKPIIVPIPLFLSTAVGAETVQQALTFAEAEVQKRNELEAALSTQGYTPKSGYPGSVYTVSTRWTSPEAANMSAAGFLMDRASQRIMQLANLTKEEVQKGIPTASGVAVHNQFCDTSYLLSLQCDTADVYRSHDGTCNNLEHVRWGSSFQSFRRILYPDYADGISAPRAAQNGAVLPSARSITTKVFMEDFVGEHVETVASYMFVLWAQFINHDIAFAPSSTGVNETAIPCCVNGKLLPTQHPECLPIAIEASDSFYANFSQQCINFVRSAPAPVCEFGPREQMNQVTSYIDGSMLYGSTEIEFTKVLGYNPPLAPGRLPQTVMDDGRTLPERSTDLNDGCNIDEVIADRKFCFKTGDRRINEYTGLTIMDTIWTRHHNLIAAHLNAVNPHWSDKIVFEESRRVVIAQIQHITYNEFLPVLLGPSLCQVVGLKLEESGYYGGYDPETNPTISDAFEAAAFRMGHSMMQGLIKMIGPKGKNEDFIQIHKLMYNPFRVYDVGRMENLIRGHAAMPAGKADLYVSNQVMQHVFQLRNNSFGMDLLAMDIQRGRDHGIPGYLQWRRICNLTSLNTYETISTIWQDGAAERISQVYGNIEDVDLYTGGLAETAIPGGVVGPTFACIIADQFLRLRKGDRFWYENSVQMKPFTPDQLALIRKTTLAQVLCQSSDSLDELQLRVMVQPTSSNPLQPCGLGLLSRLDFAPWKDFTTLTNVLSAAPTEDIEDYADEEDRVDKEVAKDLANEGRNGTDDEPIIIDFSKISPKKSKSGAKSSANGKQGDAASPS